MKESKSETITPKSTKQPFNTQKLRYALIEAHDGHLRLHLQAGSSTFNYIVTGVTHETVRDTESQKTFERTVLHIEYM